MSTKTELPRNPLADRVPRRATRFRIRTQSRVVGGLFNLVNAMTRWDIEGRENLLEAVARSKESGRGLVTVSNHVSLFDDPMVQAKLLRLRNLTVESKGWWSTACATNFNPHGKGVGATVTRLFSETANMVFMERAQKGCKAAPLPDSLSEVLAPRLGWKRMDLLGERARRSGMDVESYLRGFLTHPGPVGSALDQPGMIEACARLNVGDWLHFFPEGGRSRSLTLRPARPGVGKVLYHAPDADVLPICFYGTQDVLPVGSLVPRPFQRVVVSVGRPLNRSLLDALRAGPPTSDTFAELSRFALSGVAALRPGVLTRYLGAESAFHLLAEEQAEAALAAERSPAPAVAPALPDLVASTAEAPRPDLRS